MLATLMEHVMCQQFLQIVAEGQFFPWQSFQFCKLCFHIMPLWGSYDMLSVWKPIRIFTLPQCLLLNICHFFVRNVLYSVQIFICIFYLQQDLTMWLAWLDNILFGSHCWVSRFWKCRKQYAIRFITNWPYRSCNIIKAQLKITLTQRIILCLWWWI